MALEETSVYSKCVLFLYISYIIIPTLVTACKFPRFLQTHTVWTSNYNINDGQRVFKGYFKENYILASRCDAANNCLEYKVKCLSKIGNDKYEVEYIEPKPSAQSTYFCMQIIKRTRSIIQLRESTKLPYRSPNACNEQQLTLDNWPIFSSENFNSQRITCPFSGGYNVRLQNSNGKPTCPSEFIPPRLESECESDDGIMINFRFRECMHPALNMEIKQALYCAASWTHGSYTFVILRPQNDQFNAWCLRITGTAPLSRIEHGHLFMDFVCDPGDGSGMIRETSNYLYLEFEHHIVNSVCADQGVYCAERRFCDHELGINCPKSCKRCSGVQSPCSFPEHFRGVWIQSLGDEQKYVNVSYYGISVANSGRFQCYEPEDHDFTNSTMVMQTFDNGCFPRFACLDLVKPLNSPSTLSYRLGNRVGWPVKNMDNLKTTVCGDLQFRPNTLDRLRLGKNVEEKPMNILIDSQHHYSVHCNLDSWRGLRDGQLYLKEVGQCDTCLVYENERHNDRIVQVPLNCSSKKFELQRHHYRCIASFPRDNYTHALVTRTLHKAQEYLCWVFSLGRGGHADYGKVYIMDASDCNNVAIEALLKGDLEPKREFRMSQSPQRPCPYLGDIPFMTYTTPNLQVVGSTTDGYGFEPTQYIIPAYTSAQPVYGQPSRTNGVEAFSSNIFLTTIIILILAPL